MAESTSAGIWGERGRTAPRDSQSQLGCPGSRQVAGRGSNELQGFFIQGALPGNAPRRRLPRKLPAALGWRWWSPSSSAER